MKVQLDWGRDPVGLRRSPAMIYTVDLDEIPAAPGVYVFGRMWSDKFAALYVGKAMNMRARVKGQLNNLRLMNHVRNAPNGRRVVMTGSLVTKGGQQVERCLTLAESALIRHFLSEGHDLVNIMGTQLRRHEVASARRPRRFVPEVIYLDRGR